MFEKALDVNFGAKASYARSEVFTSSLNPSAPKKPRPGLDGVTDRLAKAKTIKRAGKSLVWSISPKGYSTYDDIQLKQYMVCTACLDAGNSRIAEFNSRGRSTGTASTSCSRGSPGSRNSGYIGPV